MSLEMRMFNKWPMRFLGGAVGQSAYRLQIFAMNPSQNAGRDASNCSMACLAQWRYL
jgi:hypothetical protein